MPLGTARLPIKAGEINLEQMLQWMSTALASVRCVDYSGAQRPVGTSASASSTGRAGTRELAQEHLTTATTMYREMGMTYWLEKAETEMREIR